MARRQRPKHTRTHKHTHALTHGTAGPNTRGHKWTGNDPKRRLRLRRAEEESQRQRGATATHRSSVAAGRRLAQRPLKLLQHVQVTHPPSAWPPPRRDVPP